MDKQEILELIEHARSVRENAYAPYSRFKVGAALKARDGQIFSGCNVENAAFTPGSCAERTAINAAVASGCREFVAIAVVGAYDGAAEYASVYPCGVCRQVIREFCDDDLEIISASSDGSFEVHTLAELLPYSFGGEIKK